MVELPFTTHGGASLSIGDVRVDTGSAGTVLSANVMAQLSVHAEPGDRLLALRGIGGRELVFTRRLDRIEVCWQGAGRHGGRDRRDGLDDNKVAILFVTMSRGTLVSSPRPSPLALDAPDSSRAPPPQTELSFCDEPAVSRQTLSPSRRFPLPAPLPRQEGEVQLVGRRLGRPGRLAVEEAPQRHPRAATGKGE